VDGLDRETRGGVIEGWAKLGEALAKIIDSLGKAGPTVSALVVSVAFLVLAYLAARVDIQRPAEAKVKYRVTNAASTCSISGFPEGSHKVDKDDLGQLLQTPPGCAEDLTRVKQDDLTGVFLVGRVDKLELRPSVQRVYGSNPGLAYQRAAAVKTYLLRRYGSQGARSSDLDARIVALSAGPTFVEGDVTPEQRAKDRSVDIVTYQLNAVPMSEKGQDAQP
jgi:hypothetical protein